MPVRGHHQFIDPSYMNINNLGINNGPTINNVTIVDSVTIMNRVTLSISMTKNPMQKVRKTLNIMNFRR